MHSHGPTKFVSRFQDCMRNVIGERQAEKALISGRMFSSEEALAVGLVDEVVPDKAACIERAEAFLASQANLPSEYPDKYTKFSIRAEQFALSKYDFFFQIR